MTRFSLRAVSLATALGMSALALSSCSLAGVPAPQGATSESAQPQPSAGAESSSAPTSSGSASQPAQPSASQSQTSAATEAIGDTPKYEELAEDVRKGLTTMTSFKFSTVTQSGGITSAETSWFTNMDADGDFRIERSIIRTRGGQMMKDTHLTVGGKGYVKMDEASLARNYPQWTPAQLKEVSRTWIPGKGENLKEAALGLYLSLTTPFTETLDSASLNMVGKRETFRGAKVFTFKLPQGKMHVSDTAPYRLMGLSDLELAAEVDGKKVVSKVPLVQIYEVGGDFSAELKAPAASEMVPQKYLK